MIEPWLEIMSASVFVLSAHTIRVGGGGLPPGGGGLPPRLNDGLIVRYINRQDV